MKNNGTRIFVKYEYGSPASDVRCTVTAIDDVAECPWNTSGYIV